MKHERHLASHVFTIVTLAIGAVALLFMMRSIGWQQASAAIAQVGAWFPVILALDLLGLGCDAAALHGFIGVDAPKVSALGVFAAQASGRAINILTPGGALGEPTKLAMLATHAPRARVVSALVLANLANLYLAVAIIVIGVPITLIAADLPRPLEITVLVALAIIVPLAAGVAILVHRGALASATTAIRWTHLISPARATAWKEKLREVDDDLRELHGGGPRRAIAYVGASRVLDWLTTCVLLHALAIPITAKLLVGVFSVGVLLGWASSIVPLGLGIADGGSYALYAILDGTGAHGLFMALLGRIRQLSIALVGLAIMTVGHVANRIRLAKRRAPT